MYAPTAFTSLANTILGSTASHKLAFVKDSFAYLPAGTVSTVPIATRFAFVILSNVTASLPFGTIITNVFATNGRILSIKPFSFN